VSVLSAHRRSAALVAVLVLTAVLGTAGAAAKSGRATVDLTIFAAASLTDVMPAVEKDNTYSFAGSNALATQIRNGAPADVFLSANTEIPALLHQQGFVDAPVNFTRNTLAVVVPKSNPAGIKTIFDLGKPGVKVVMAAPSVPVGGYTLQVLRQMNLSSKVLPNTVSQETDVRSVLSKIALGQGDAGFVYSTDAATVAGDVLVIKVPAWAQPKVLYAMAVVSRSGNKPAARAFVAKVLGKQGQATFQRFGFLALPGAGRKADVSKLTVVKLSARVSRGAAASLTVSSPLKAACTIRVFNAKGKAIAAKGLVRKAPNAAGTIVWRWVVPKAALTGRSPIRVSCGATIPSLRTSYTVLR